MNNVKKPIDNEKAVEVTNWTAHAATIALETAEPLNVL